MRSRLAILIAIIALAQAAPTRAHRLDEYLQASRVAVGLDRVVIDIDLTPGVSVAREIIASIDTNGDGAVSPAERRSYTEQVLTGLRLSVDGQAARLTMGDAMFPDVEAMRGGIGVIRLRATAAIGTTASGHHQLEYRNAHNPQTSVYLANALVPEDSRIRIVDQRRDRAQHELTLDYDVALPPLWTRALWIFTGLASVALLVVSRRRVSSVTTSDSPLST